MANVKALQTALDEMNREYPRPRMPPLTLSSPYDLKQDWKSKYPSSDFPGVYVLVDEGGEVAYIGKSSCTIGGRLANYFRHDDDRNWMLKDSTNWQAERLKTLFTIGLESTHWFEAGAIEDFLIYKLDPRLNRQGRPKG